MNRRSIVAILAFLALPDPDPIWAQDNGNGHGQGSENGNGNGASGGNGNGNGAPARDSPRPQSGSGATTSTGTVTATSSSPSSGAASSAPAASAELSESDVLAAVESGSAVALSTILPDVRSRTGGEVVNAQLQQVRGFLLYAVTVLTPGGKVITQYYYARSGQHVEP